MTVEVQNNPVQEPKTNDKEYNFRQIEKRLQEERAEKERLAQKTEQLALELEQLKKASYKKAEEEEDNYGEPYVDEKRLEKKLAKFGNNTQSEIQKAMQSAKEAAKEEVKRELFLENNSDFYDVLQNHADKLAQKAPRLAESILRMPDGFERQKLVYENIKVLGLDKPEQKPSSIQDKIDANRKSPFYQPSGVPTSPYAAAGDFSVSGQKNAYAKMQELKNKMRI